MRDVALHVHLRLLALGGCRQRHDAEDPGADAFDDALNHPTLSRRIAPLEHNDNLEALVFYPELQLDELCLELCQMFLELSVLEFRRLLAGRL